MKSASAGRAAGPERATSAGVLAVVPFVLGLSVAAFVLLPRVAGNQRLVWSFAGVCGGL
jgi:hypothetical protein